MINSSRTMQAKIYARRVPNGAVVTVRRADGRKHSYRVGLRRYHRLCDTLNVHLGASGGYYYWHRFGAVLHEVQGFVDARRWLLCRFRRSGCFPEHWRAA
jgi:hypothetical protein